MAEGNDDQGPVAVGAFVMPNQEINNSTALITFDTPVEAVERYVFQWRANSSASGLEFLKNLPASRRRKLCDDIDCSVIVREFENRSQQVKRLPAPGSARK